jgi:septin family protein
LEKNNIKIYPTHHAEDRDFIGKSEKHIPFGVIGSDDLVDVNGKKMRGRTYKWGSVQVENPLHCDFVHLRDLLIW